MAEPVSPLSVADILVLAASGVGKVDRDGARGAMLISHDEAIAMAILLAALGVPALRPDTPAQFVGAYAAELTAFLNTRFNGGSNDH